VVFGVDPKLHYTPEFSLVRQACISYWHGGTCNWIYLFLWCI